MSTDIAVVASHHTLTNDGTRIWNGDLAEKAGSVSDPRFVVRSAERPAE
jgi:hypothetical protein